MLNEHVGVLQLNLGNLGLRAHLHAALQLSRHCHSIEEAKATHPDLVRCPTTSTGSSLLARPIALTAAAPCVLQS